MIKIFNENDKNFSSNGNIVINPIKCLEKKEKSLNGWSLEVEVSTKYKDDIKQDMLCVVKTKSKLMPQAFRIKNIKSTKHKLKFTAEHVIFDARDYFLLDVRAVESNTQTALNYINERTDKLSPFLMHSDVNNTGTAYFIRKNLLEAWSIIEERWGGNFDADNFDIHLKKQVGHDNGESLNYGADLIDVEVLEDWSNVVTRLYPVGPDGIMLEEKYIESEIEYPTPYTTNITFESEIEAEEDEEVPEAEILEELRVNAINYINENQYPKVSYVVKSNVKESLEIGDTVEVRHPLVTIKTEVQKYTYNILTKKVIELEFGNYDRDVKKRFDSIKSDIEDTKNKVSNNEYLIKHQTDLINQLNKNGFVYIDENEILILDELPKSEAKNVWRFGLGGIGFSSNGYVGPFDFAFTSDGQFNIDFINANSITVNHLSSDVGSSLDISSNNAINQIVTQIDETTGLLQEEISSQVQQTVDSFDVIFNKIEADQGLTNDEVALIQSYFRINENGVIIGKSDSAIEFFAENNRVGFRENGKDIAYWEEGTMHVDRLIAVTTIMVGYHLIEKYDSPVAGNTTIVRLGD